MLSFSNKLQEGSADSLAAVGTGKKKQRANARKGEEIGVSKMRNVNEVDLALKNLEKLKRRLLIVKGGLTSPLLSKSYRSKISKAIHECNSYFKKHLKRLC